VSKALWTSVAFHLAVLVLVGWALTYRAGGVFRSVSVRLGTSVAERALSPPSTVERGLFVLPTVSGDQPASGLGIGEPAIDALTPGPAAETPSLADYPSPGYPAEARRLGWEGVVEIEVEVSAQGSWSGGRLLRSSGHGPLDDAALEALRRARYLPASHNGVPEAGVLDALVRFRLK